MSKILDATCQGGVVTVDEVPVPGTRILSKGTGQSEGVLLVQGRKKTYVPKAAPDLEATLDRLIAALDKAVTALNQTASALQTLDTSGFLIAADMGVPSPPQVASNISQIQSAASDISTAKGDLETLKGNLI